MITSVMGRCFLGDAEWRAFRLEVMFKAARVGEWWGCPGGSVRREGDPGAESRGWRGGGGFPEAVGKPFPAELWKPQIFLPL